MSDFIFDAAKLERVVAICTDPRIGIRNCLRLNREYFRLLQKNAPELFKIGGCPWVEGWLEMQKDFLLQLFYGVKTVESLQDCVWLALIKELCLPNTPHGTRRGVFKFIDENRQLWELITLQIPDFVQSDFGRRVAHGTACIDHLFCEIARIMEVSLPEMDDGRLYPRPWLERASVENPDQRY